jgi:Short repeat of unknown function (DUF308)
VMGPRPGGFLWEMLLAGVVSVVAGVLTFLWPGLTALALLYFIAVWAIVRGVFEIVAAVQLRKEIENEWLLGLSGLLTIVLGLFLMVAPGAGILAVLWWVGATAIVFGILMIILGFRLKGVQGPALEQWAALSRTSSDGRTAIGPREIGDSWRERRLDLLPAGRVASYGPAVRSKDNPLLTALRPV